MFASAELGRRLTKEEFEAAVPQLRLELVELQRRLRGADFAVIVMCNGVDGAGKSETVNLINEWMDPRWIETNAYLAPSEEERERPEFWRYWRDLPPHGTLGLYLGAWYTQPILDRAHRRIGGANFDRALERIARFERLLADDGTLIVKFWFHLGKQQQRERLKSLEEDPLQSWRISDTDWKHWRMYDQFVTVVERALRRTSVAHAPWNIIEGTDHRYRSLTAATILRDAISERLEHGPRPTTAIGTEPGQPTESAAAERRDPAVRAVGPVLETTVLSSLDMTLQVARKAYDRELLALQGGIHRLFRQAKARKVSLVVLFEGWDAAGKGGAIRRLTRALDARDYRVIPVAAPTDEERARHYLWRFWRQLRRAGRVTIFDRSWYGRVLVERVEGFASEQEWRRAYVEINDFEEQLVEFGIVFIKFWLHITKDEQLRRFNERGQVPYKQWKITEEDWRNREGWERYEAAVQEMVERTSTVVAPWTLVAANSKRSARLKVLRTVAEALERALEQPSTRTNKKKRSRLRIEN